MLEEQPNIILITIDTLRADILGAYGGRIPTPNLDSLAERGVLFARAITNGDHTRVAFPALHSSTYGSMYTGSCGPLSSERPALAELLRETGYHTAAVVTSPLLGREFGYDRGFDQYCELEPLELGATWPRFKPALRLLRLTWPHTILAALDVDTRQRPLYADAIHVTDTALEVLHNMPRPFFLWIHYMDIHWPYHRETEAQGGRELAMSWRDLGIYHKAQSIRLQPIPEDLNRLRSLYQQAVCRVDDQVGRLLSGLDRTGSGAKKTLVLVTSDHGEEFWEHGALGHTSLSLYQEILHVPLLAWGAGIAGQQTIGAQVQWLDLAPTLLHIAHGSIPAAMLGKSLLPLMQGEPFEGHLFLVSEVVTGDGHGGSRLVRLAVLRDSHKLIWTLAAPANYEVYDLEADPREQRNLRGRYPELEEQLLSIARQHLLSVRVTQTQGSVDELYLDRAVADRLAGLGYLS